METRISQPSSLLDVVLRAAGLHLLVRGCRIYPHARRKGHQVYRAHRDGAERRVYSHQGGALE
jgi:hypothetical protein